ncbi:MAG: peroxiredoxin [Acidobacteria bacterium]|nr:peroxiredoxin [Acidobacteriota bacterium]
MTRLEVGATAPPFSLPNHDGELVTSHSLSGQRFVLYFYPADDTPGCTVEACGFNDELKELRRLGVRVVGVSPDDGASHRAFRAKYALGFDLLSDPATTTMAAYGAYGEKMLYGKQVVGVIRSTFVVGPTGLIEHAWYGPRTKGHAERVRAVLEG